MGAVLTPVRLGRKCTRPWDSKSPRVLNGTVITVIRGSIKEIAAQGIRVAPSRVDAMPLRVATIEGGAYSRMEGLGKRGASGLKTIAFASCNASVPPRLWPVRVARLRQKAGRAGAQALGASVPLGEQPAEEGQRRRGSQALRSTSGTQPPLLAHRRWPLQGNGRTRTAVHKQGICIKITPIRLRLLSRRRGDCTVKAVCGRPRVWVGRPQHRWSTFGRPKLS